jgi:transposase
LPSSPSPPTRSATARIEAPAARGGRPVNFDADRHRGRNVVERGFNRLKNWRGLATRYEKHVMLYRGGMVLGAALLWL